MMRFQGKSEMRSALIIFGMFAVVCCGTATGAIFQRDSTVKFKVIDYGGNPISNANVCVRTFKKWVPGEGFGRDITMDIRGKTDTNGLCKVSFLCKSLQFEYGVGAVGYYSAYSGMDVHFARAGSGFTLRQTQFETNLIVRLKPILKPIPMYVHASYKDSRRHFPKDAKSGVWGFDLKMGEWVKPYGNGEHSDFTVEYSYEHFSKDRVVDCALVFTNGVHDGFYMAKCTGTIFRSGYTANTNAVYMKRLDFDSWGKKYKGNYAVELLDDDEYLVVRTRTKCDAHGNLISAYYAKIYGPIRFNDLFSHQGAYFNPNENDPNLEADATVNLMPGGEKGFAP